MASNAYEASVGFFSFLGIASDLNEKVYMEHTPTTSVVSRRFKKSFFLIDVTDFVLDYIFVADLIQSGEIFFGILSGIATSVSFLIWLRKNMILRFHMGDTDVVLDQILLDEYFDVGRERGTGRDFRNEYHGHIHHASRMRLYYLSMHEVLIFHIEDATTILAFIYMNDEDISDLSVASEANIWVTLCSGLAMSLILLFLLVSDRVKAKDYGKIEIKYWIVAILYACILATGFYSFILIQYVLLNNREGAISSDLKLTFTIMYIITCTLCLVYISWKFLLFCAGLFGACVTGELHESFTVPGIPERHTYAFNKRKGDQEWNQHFAELKSFHRVNSHLSIHESYYAQHPGLKEWVSDRKGTRPMYLTSERKRDLDRIGFEWNTR